jgi:hypothetical protein
MDFREAEVLAESKDPYIHGKVEFHKVLSAPSASRR